MITSDADTGTLAVHRLVQRLARTPDLEDTHRSPGHIGHARDAATNNLLAALPRAMHDPATWPTWRALLPHADALIDNIAPDTDTHLTAAVMGAAGMFLDDQGLHTRAIRYFQRALTALERVMGGVSNQRRI
ncbi:hypothetical protein AR457_40445 [Streptomyces agglomeratus]|uniref:hypothetical protein n=1 Tax=Streptomyces agglomeratus TaxID=285458 RepID=UPI0008524C1E|nr:hypothetical protein [Streptomyces agglomeratus]OEJ22148.1 hypothetical protein AR457_40445 [Streptomyces agglomeratus]OEJ36986.1 hypothetical protein BGK70_01100 [Streptomyces agglomeratus]